MTSLLTNEENPTSQTVVSTVTAAAAACTSSSSSTASNSLEELTREVEVLKKKLEEERAKFNDVERNYPNLTFHLNLLNFLLTKASCASTIVHVVAQKLDAINGLQLKARRVLKGHQVKLLSIDWSGDKRHIASTSQVSSFWLTFHSFLSYFFVIPRKTLF